LRVADAPIRLRCEIYEPDDLVVLDPTLINAIDVTAGLKPGGSILINSPQPPAHYEKLIADFRVFTVDASAVAIKHGLGSRTQPIVNTAILGAFAEITKIVALDSVCAAIAEEVSLYKQANVDAARAAAGLVRVSLPEAAHV
jgi:pyruvate ferredoxin oxidoreductase gamma subunit/2-oxoisovalerate ferredoxin oxidoreductase gamma subunit